MKWETLLGKKKDIPIGPYRVDFDGSHGSEFSEEVLDFFYPYWKNDVVAAEYPVAGTKMRFDFVNFTKKIILETDGEQHDTFIKGFFHATSADFLSQIKRDVQKDTLAELNGFQMIRIKPGDLPLTKEWVEKTFDITL